MTLDIDAFLARARAYAKTQGIAHATLSKKLFGPNRTLPGMLGELTDKDGKVLEVSPRVSTLLKADEALAELERSLSDTSEAS